MQLWQQKKHLARLDSRFYNIPFAALKFNEPEDDSFQEELLPFNYLSSSWMGLENGSHTVTRKISPLPIDSKTWEETRHAKNLHKANQILILTLICFHTPMII